MRILERCFMGETPPAGSASSRSMTQESENSQAEVATEVGDVSVSQRYLHRTMGDRGRNRSGPTRRLPLQEIHARNYVLSLLRNP